MVARVVHLGFEVRIELELPDGSIAGAQLTRAQAEELELDDGRHRVRAPSRRGPDRARLEGAPGGPSSSAALAADLAAIDAAET